MGSAGTWNVGWQVEGGRRRHAAGVIGRKGLMLILMMGVVRVCGAHAFVSPQAMPSFLHRHKLSKYSLQKYLVNALGR